MDDEKVLITESTLDEIADAIREKNGETFKYYPREMPSAVRRIPTGTGGGSVVAVFPILYDGEHIADIVVDGETFALYAPEPIEYTQGTGIEISQDGTVSVSEALRQTIAGKVDTSSFNTAIASLSASVASKQDMLTAGQNITIQNNVISATGGGASAVSDLTDVDLNDLADGQVLKWNATDEVWENADESGGGSNVSITPTLSSGTKIADFEIDGTAGSLYAPNGGGGSASGYEQTELFTSTTPVNSGTLTLSDDISNYDILCFEYALVGSYGSGDNSLSYKYVDTNYFMEAFPNTATRETDHLIIDGYDNFYLYAKMGNADNKIDVWNVGSPNTGVLKVFGIKYGAGGGQGGDAYERTELFKSAIPQSGVISLSDAIDNYDDIEIVMGWVTASDTASHVERFNAEYFVTNFPYAANPSNANPHALLEMWASQGFSCAVGDATNTALQTWGHNGSPAILAVYGIKYGSGGGGGGGSSLPFDVVIDPNDNGINLVPNGGGGGGSSQEEYSTTEKVIGKWINGKPLYQKTVYSATLGTGQIVPIAHGISNLGVVVGVEATCFDSGYENAWFPISHISTDGYNISIFSVDGTNINFSNPTAFGSRITEVYATIKYTKTTD